MRNAPGQRHRDLSEGTFCARLLVCWMFIETRSPLRSFRRLDRYERAKAQPEVKLAIREILEDAALASQLTGVITIFLLIHLRKVARRLA
jgi:hypothetical protein